MPTDIDPSNQSEFTFGGVLRNARLHAGLRLRKLGEAVGYSEAHMARLEKSQRVPNPVIVAERLVPALGLLVDKGDGKRLIELAHQAHLTRNMDRVKRATPIATRLPAQLTRFVGRTRERSRLHQVFSSNDRIVTLCGPGGVGKTRLGLEVATMLIEEDAFRDGVWFVDLSDVTEPAQVLPTIADWFKATGTGGNLLALADHLHDRNGMLFLDNSEHVLDSVRSIAAHLLASCPQIKLLLTSREPLNIAGEAVFLVPPLSAAEAAELFTDRARAASQDTNFSSVEMALVSSICQILDRLPLAIELAASRLRNMSINQVATLLSSRSRFSLLADGNRGANRRHQTLRNLIDWSFSLLNEPERTLLRRLSVFAGGWSLEAAEAVCADGTFLLRENILDLLLNLTSKSLVSIETRGGRGRYRFLESIREYAKDALSTGDEYQQTRNRQLHYVLRLAKQAEVNLRFEDQKTWRERLLDDHENILAALSWARDIDSHEDGGRILLAIYWYFYDSVRWDDYERWVDTLILNRPDTPLEMQAEALVNVGTMRLNQGEFDRAEALLRSALKLCQRLQLNHLTIRVLSIFSWRLIDDRKALAATQKAIALARKHGLKWELGLALLTHGTRLAAVNAAAKATAAFEECLNIATALNDHGTRITALYELCNLLIKQNALDEARLAAEQALKISDQYKTTHNKSRTLLALGKVAASQNDVQRVIEVIHEGVALFRNIGHASLVAEHIALASRVAQLCGKHETAAILLYASQAIRTYSRIYMTTSDQSYDERMHAEIQRNLDRPTLRQAWMRGSQMTTDEAIDSALATAAEAQRMALKSKKAVPVKQSPTGTHS